MKLADRLKKYAWPAYLVMLFAVSLSTLYAAAAMPSHHHTPAAGSTDQPECARVGKTISVRVTEKGFIPSNVSAQRCDKLVYTNDTARDVVIAFGPHTAHIAYPGLTVEAAAPKATTTVILAKTGYFPVHDHDKESIAGQVTVSD